MIDAVALGPNGEVYSASRAKGKTAIVRHEPKRASRLFETSDQVRALWVSKSGVVHAAGKRHHTNRSGAFVTAKLGKGSTYALWGSGDDRLFAGGDAGLWELRDGAWRDVGIEGTTFALAGSGADDLYAGGDESPLMHFDGKSWKKVALKTHLVQAIVCVAPDDVLVLGVSGGATAFRGNARTGFRVIGELNDEAYGIGEGAGGVYVHQGFKLHRAFAEATEVEERWLMAKNGDFPTAMTSNGTRVVAAGGATVLVDDGDGFVPWAF